MTGYQNNAAEFEEFVEDTQTRHLYYTLSSDNPRRALMAVGPTPFSKACNESWFLLALQNVPRDEWMKLQNKPYWQYLHLGSSEPN